MARELITDAGYGDRFVHRTGHGIGLELHEPPYIVQGNETPLQAGMLLRADILLERRELVRWLLDPILNVRM